MSIDNLYKLYVLSDPIDRREGKLAYRRYRKVMQSFADHYGFPLHATTSAFVALSPNNDYLGNLRSLASVLKGVQEGRAAEDITVTTFKACRNRAYSYVTGTKDFLSTVKGLKIRAFRDNIMRPNSSQLVTVDGHMIAAWHGRKLTMKEASRFLKGPKHYKEIEQGIQAMALAENMAPCQMQAVLWFTRKRINNIIYEPQLNLFAGNDQWDTLIDPKYCKPYQ